MSAAIYEFVDFIGEARIRVQLSAVHSTEDVNRCVDAFIDIGRAKGVIS